MNTVPQATLASAAALALLAASGLSHATSSPTVIHVSQSASGANDGSSWPDAFVDLQDALDLAAQDSGIREIRVAKGTYTPDRGTGDRTAHFSLRSGVVLRGGYAGAGADDPDARDPQSFLTVLSGDLLGDDTPQLCTDFSNCCMEREDIGCEDATCQDIVCAKKPECCGEDGPPSTWKWSLLCAAEAWRLCCGLEHICDNSINVVVARNVDATAVLDGFVIRGGYASGDNALEEWRGGGMLVEDAGPTISNCVFERNIALNGGGITIAGSSSSPTIIGTSFFLNRGTGSAYWQQMGSCTIQDCLFEDNFYGTAAVLRPNEPSLVDGSVFRRNQSSGMFIDGPTTVRRCRFEDHPTTALAISTFPPISQGSIVIDCLFMGNRRGLGVSSSRYLIANSRFLDNLESALNIDIAHADVINCEISGNKSANGVSVTRGASADIRNCTIFGNGKDGYPIVEYFGIALIEESSARITNCAIWDNGNRDRDPDGPQIYVDVRGSRATVNYSLVQDWDGSLGGVGNFAADPKFRDPLGPDGVAGTLDDDLRPAPGSPLIDAGDPNVTSPDYDIDWHRRPLCGRMDIGAYEFGIGDYDCNGCMQLSDLSSLDDCLTGPGSGNFPPGCETYDFQADDAIDLLDLARLQREPMHPGRLCAPGPFQSEGRILIPWRTSGR